MNLKTDIKPITYLKNRTSDVVEIVSAGRSMIITQNGEAKMVVMGVMEYDRLQSALALLRIVQHSEADLRADRTLTQDQVFTRAEDLIRVSRQNRRN